MNSQAREGSSEKVNIYHYENLPMQYTEIFSAVKIENFIGTFLIFFLKFAQNIDCGYTLEQPRRGGSNEYPQSMFWSKNNKNNPCIPKFCYTNVGNEGVYFTWTCFPDAIGLF